jgi:hypothetical protein
MSGSIHVLLKQLKQHNSDLTDAIQVKFGFSTEGAKSKLAFMIESRVFSNNIHNYIQEINSNVHLFDQQCHKTFTEFDFESDEFQIYESELAQIYNTTLEKIDNLQTQFSNLGKGFISEHFNPREVDSKFFHQSNTEYNKSGRIEDESTTSINQVCTLSGTYEVKEDELMEDNNETIDPNLLNVYSMDCNVKEEATSNIPQFQLGLPMLTSDIFNKFSRTVFNQEEKQLIVETISTTSDKTTTTKKNTKNPLLSELTSVMTFRKHTKQERHIVTKVSTSKVK